MGKQKKSPVLKEEAVSRGHNVKGEGARKVAISEAVHPRHLDLRALRRLGAHQRRIQALCCENYAGSRLHVESSRAAAAVCHQPIF
jgi:hypothetical protein